VKGARASSPDAATRPTRRANAPCHARLEQLGRGKSKGGTTPIFWRQKCARLCQMTLLFFFFFFFKKKKKKKKKKLISLTQQTHTLAAQCTQRKR